MALRFATLGSTVRGSAHGSRWRFVSWLLALVVCGVVAAPAGAEEYRISLDPEETTIRFTLGATAHVVEGSLELRRGELTIDPAAGTAGGRLEIDAKSSETGNARRDKTMHTKVLEVGDHPLITFTAESFDGSLPAAGEATAELHGTVTLVGGEHPLTLPLELDLDEGRFEAGTRFSVPFVAWGLHDPSMFLLRVEKVVEVEVQAKGTLSPVDAETSSPDEP